MTKQTRLILVGGFLGAGKTTLLWRIAKNLTEKGLRVGLVTNDQAPELVDTELLLANGLKVSELSGSCFCCNFNGFIDKLNLMKAEVDADVIIAEPVGSCTDLSATIVQPLKANFNKELVISPLTVLVEPLRLMDILVGGNGGLHPSAAYIVRKQVEEADIILINKIDTVTPEQLELLKNMISVTVPHADVMEVSAKTGDNVDEWLDNVMHRNDAGKQLAEVDYDTYAEGEAVLGWLNVFVSLHGNMIDWDKVASDLMVHFQSMFKNMAAGVGHVKLFMKNSDKYTVMNLTDANKTVGVVGRAGSGNDANLTINARVEMSPETLDVLVHNAIDKVVEEGITATINEWKCLSPGRPNPTHRFTHVVKI